MAECGIDCSMTESTVSATCGSNAVTIPSIPNTLPDITIPDAGTVTEELVSGNGIFDIYMRAGANQLQTQYDLGRIKGKEYTDAYMQLIQIMMVEANKFALGIVQAEIAAQMFPIQYLTAGYDAALKEAQAEKIGQEIKLLCQQIAELKENGAVERLLKSKQAQVQIKQAELYKRQIKGFDEKASNDASKVMMDAWAVHAVEEPSGTYDSGLEKGGGAPTNLARISNRG